MIRSLWIFAAMGVALVSGASAHAKAPITGIAAYPPDINLSFAQDRQKFVVVATREDGVTLDVTGKCQIALSNPSVARIDDATLYPVTDGEATLTIEYEGHKATIPVKVTESGKTLPISFKTDVMPVFMRTGCNTGSCHGAARGKDGFALSLFGFDPEADYFRITREQGARRINLALPASSLLMEKGCGDVPHTGGKRFDKNSEYYATLLKWLEEGAPADPQEPPACVKVEIFPPKAVLEGADATQQFIVRGIYADGTDRDITSLTVFMSNNDNSAPVNESGLVTAASRGEAFIMARFDTHTVVSQVIVLPADLQYERPPVTGNYIDELVGDKLHKLRILPSELCTDEEFLRRVTLDITGTLPTVQEYDEFMGDPSPDKRAKLIDRLLQRKEFSEIWAMKWAELLMIKSSNQVSYKAAYLYNAWLTDKIANNVPLNEMVRELLSATGGTFTEPATNFYQIETDTLKTAENVAQIFMGIRTQCAQCHNHPFDRWTMDDYYSFAAFFSQIGRKRGEDYRETIVFDRGGGEVRHLVGNRVMKPKFLGGEEPDTAGKDRRAVLAEWLTSPENPFFARNVSNRIWAHFFGKGIVEPVDDVRVSNPPSNPELLDTLAQKLIEYNYDFKALVRDICNSHAYQRSTVRNESNAQDELNFAHGAVRRIQAEMLLDCISQVTETKDKFRGLPLGARAVQIADGQTSTYFLTTFGRATRQTVCACEVNTDPNLSQALHLLNGDTAQNKISQGGLVKRLLDEGKTPEEVIDAIYIRCLTRKPTAEETAKLLEVVQQSATPQQGLEDVFWAVINSREFIFNH